MVVDLTLKSILFCAANPKETIHLRLDEEERVIRDRLRLAGYGKAPINSTRATRIGDFQQAMLDFKPQIVHFSGHGAREDGLVFEDASGNEKLVNAKPLANLFKLFYTKTPIECVVLNACYSEIQANEIAKNVDHVIGMNSAISDSASIEFSFGFYTALGAGESIEFAYEMGCIAIQLEGIEEHLTPILLKKDKVIHFHQDEDVQIYDDDSSRSITVEETTSPVICVKDDLLARLILQFLEQYSRWFFNAPRIRGWGSERSGYREFKKYSVSEIDQCLQSLSTANRLRTKTSKRGTTLYAVK